MDRRTSLNGFPKVAVQMGGGSDGKRTWISGFPKVAVQMGGGSDGKRSASARILASDLVLVHFEAKHKDFKAFWRFPGSQLASPAGLRDVFVQVNLKMIFSLKNTLCGGAIIAPKTEKSSTNHDFAAVLRIRINFGREAQMFFFRLT